MSYRLSGGNPLSYRGVEPSSPPNFVFFKRAPLTTDINFAIGTIWENYDLVTTYPTPIYEIYMLVARSATKLTSGQIATWVKLYPSGVSGATQFPTDNGTANQVEGILNLLAETTTGGILTTMGSGNTVTYNGASTIANNYTGNAGPGATPSANILQIVGTGNVSTNATGNTVTISLAGAVATQYTTQDGVAIPATNNINIYGEPLLLNTTASGSTVTVNLTDSSSNGEVIIGGGGSGPAWNFITSIGGTINITFPNPNEINLENAGSVNPNGPGGFAVVAASSNNAYVYTPVTNVPKVYGADYTMPTIADNSGGAWYQGDGAGTGCSYTAPITGIYLVQITQTLTYANPTNNAYYNMTINVVNGAATYSGTPTLLLTGAASGFASFTQLVPANTLDVLTFNYILNVPTSLISRGASISVYLLATT